MHTLARTDTKHTLTHTLTLRTDIPRAPRAIKADPASIARIFTFSPLTKAYTRTCRHTHTHLQEHTEGLTHTVCTNELLPGLLHNCSGGVGMRKGKLKGTPITHSSLIAVILHQLSPSLCFSLSPSLSLSLTHSDTVPVSLALRFFLRCGFIIFRQGVTAVHFSLVVVMAKGAKLRLLCDLSPWQCVGKLGGP